MIRRRIDQWLNGPPIGTGPALLLVLVLNVGLWWLIVAVVRLFL